MKKFSKNFVRIFSLILILFTIAPLCLCTNNIEPTKDFFINDYANILTEKTKSELMSNAVKLYKDTTAQVVFLSVNSLDGKDIQEYSVDIFRSWGIGDKEQNNGVLFVFSLEDRQMWVTTGYGVEDTLTDIKLGKLRDVYAMPHYKNDNFNQGTKELFNALVNELRVSKYGLDPIGDYQGIDYVPIENNGSLPLNNFLIYLTGFCPFIFIFIAIFKLFIFPNFKLRYLMRYDEKHGTHKSEAYAEKIRKQTEKLIKYNQQHNTGGGSGFSGGSFHSDGGGGGSFSGGGGSTGGGGAGGSF